jgi:hypothetical protein
LQYKRKDGIWEIQCLKCKTLLTEQITNPLPETSGDAMFKAWAAGWEILPGKIHCPGCVDVQN